MHFPQGYPRRQQEVFVIHALISPFTDVILRTRIGLKHIYIRAAFDDAFLVVTLPLTQPRFHHRDKVKVKPSNLNVHYSCTKCGIYLLFKFPFFLFVAYSNIKMLYVDILCTINNPESVLGLLNSRDHQNHIDPQEISRIKQ